MRSHHQNWTPKLKTGQITKIGRRNAKNHYKIRCAFTDSLETAATACKQPRTLFPAQARASDRTLRLCPSRPSTRSPWPSRAHTCDPFRKSGVLTNSLKTCFFLKLLPELSFHFFRNVPITFPELFLYCLIEVLLHIELFL